MNKRYLLEVVAVVKMLIFLEPLPETVVDSESGTGASFSFKKLSKLLPGSLWPGSANKHCAKVAAGERECPVECIDVAERHRLEHEMWREGQLACDPSVENKLPYFLYFTSRDAY
jgi:hypothetical protein